MRWDDVRVVRYLGGRANQHWLVTSGRQPLVPRRYQLHPIGEIGYELRVMRRLADLGWPTPVAVADPVRADGRTWCLFRWLPDERTQRDRGRLLARLHADLATIDIGQRPGAQRAEDVVADPSLTDRLRAYERMFPDEARLPRWHVDRAREIFRDVDPGPLMVLHGDFISQNLLYQDGVCTGVIDFEGTHLNHRASDFALAWRGRHDAVVHGYSEVTPLTGLDRALLTPALWSWVFLGVAREIGQMLGGTVAPHRLEWQTKMLRRSPLMGRHNVPYVS
ncbi:MAG TPA: phosphotransferase [Pseudonocardiaceae bacterium]|nr:phosphotransferase [Pseudonocardiaceae bacterium]